MPSLKSDILLQWPQAVIYARVSSKEQEKEGFSIPAQLRLLHDYAGQNQLHIAKEFVDVETAKRAGRTGFSEMRAFLAKHPNIKTILVEKTDRLYRNIRDWVTLDSLGVAIHLVKEGVVISDDSGSSEKFMHGIKVLMAKNYVDNLSEETRKGMVEKAEQGIWPSQAPLGYRNIVGSNGKKTIAPDPDIAPLIVKAFEWYASENYSIKELGNKLRGAGMVFRKSQKPVPTSTIHKILRNRIYTGQFEWKDKLYDGTYEPIISIELWEAAQAVATKKLGNRRKEQKHDFAFSGLITCSKTGGYLVGEIKKQKYIYYRAIGAKGVPYVKQETLEAEFGQVLQQLRFDDDVLDWVLKALKESHADKQAFHEQSLKRLQNSYNRLERRISTMYVDKLDGKVTEQFFDQQSSTWRQEQKSILGNIQRLQNASQSYLEEGSQLLELANNAYSLFMKQPTSEKRKLLNFMVSNCVWEDGTLSVNFKQPFDFIAKSSADVDAQDVAKYPQKPSFEIWLPRFDALRTSYYNDVLMIFTNTPSLITRKTAGFRPC